MPDPFSSQAVQAKRIAHQLSSAAHHHDCSEDICAWQANAIPVIATALTLAHQQGRVEEREACAKVAETFTVPGGCDEPYCLGWETAERGIAAAIRGRGSHDS